MAPFIRSLIFTAPSKHTVVHINTGGPGPHCWKGLLRASFGSLAVQFHLIGFVSSSTPNARIDINLKRKICRYNGFCAVSTLHCRWWSNDLLRAAAALLTLLKAAIRLNVVNVSFPLASGEEGPLGHPARSMLNQTCTVLFVLMNRTK